MCVKHSIKSIKSRSKIKDEQRGSVTRNTMGCTRSDCELRHNLGVGGLD